MKQKPAKGTTAKHAGSGHKAKAKAGATSKHHPAKQQHAGHKASAHQQKAHTVAKHPKPAKRRGLALGQAVACCPAEAVAAAARLSGHAISSWDVLALHRHVADGPAAGATIRATLEAAAARGVAGIRPHFEPVKLAEITTATRICNRLILGVELPGPHAVAVAPDGCWLSWGEHYDPACWPGAVIEEAWQVVWP